MKDNRLGGSKTAYRTDYKQDPNPRQGPINYDVIWDFSVKQNQSLVNSFYNKYNV